MYLKLIFSVLIRLSTASTKISCVVPLFAVRCIVQPLKNVSLIYDVTYLLGSVADLVLLNNFDRKQSLVLQVAHEVHCAEGALAQQTHRFEVVNRHFLFGRHVT